jgi:hypothetical protein
MQSSPPRVREGDRRAHDALGEAQQDRGNLFVFYQLFNLLVSIEQSAYDRLMGCEAIDPILKVAEAQGRPSSRRHLVVEG